MSSPVMENNPYFRPGAVTPNRDAAPNAPYGTYQDMNVPNAPVQVADYEYSMPAAHESYPAYTVETMKYNDALQKTGILLGVTVISAFAAWFLLPMQMLMPLAIGGSIAALVIGIVASRQRLVKPGLAIAYTVLEGATLGAITGALNVAYPGIAFQAVLGTFIVVAVAAGLHFSGKVRTSGRGMRIVMTLLIAAIIYALVDMVLVLTGVLGQSMDYFKIGGIPIGIIFGLILIVAAGYSLIGDLELIRNAELNGAPKEFAWTCAFGLVISIIWIYIEVLRILAILASDR
ncbi:MAG: Bax inhibitor-1/YccA family protein [Actinomycetaceae bacterium]|nr:Bax inhibitor-1/YccA family protein [Actinomycetaceae bacterium]